MNNQVCFVMQPFDQGKFDRRYEDIFAPALTECGIKPYRVDKDPGVIIPIEEIEAGIRSADICFAEITTDNPNVWFELGYAIACGKDVILVCADERDTPFPFDVRHRNIIKYNTDSPSAYEELRKKIITRTNALLVKQSTVASIKPNLVETEGLSEHEINALITIMVHSMDSNGIAGFDLKKEMDHKGFNEIATSIAIKKLLSKNMIEKTTLSDFNGYEYPAFFTTTLGENWVIENEEKVVLKTPESELPF